MTTALAFVIYVWSSVTAPSPLEKSLLDQLEVCERMDRMAESLRTTVQPFRVTLVKELQEFGRDKRFEFQAPLAELVEAEVSGARNLSIGARNEISHICAEIESELQTVDG